ncbi:MAG TPA: glycosyltransferase family 39 protein [Gemmatimonadaceae bacterium]|jgi:hypothetical protein
MHRLDAYRAVRRRLGVAGVVVAFYVFAATVVSSMLSKTLLDGETSLLSNPVIDFARKGVWHYPLHAQDIFFPGVKPFMIHPPLHYVLASGIVAAFGVGTWQLIAVSAVVGILGMAIAAYVSARIWGYGTALVSIAIAAALYGFYFSADQLRCDITFGFTYALFLLVFGRVLVRKLSTKALRAHSLLIGVLGIATLASHWFGYFVQLYVVGYVVLVIVRGRERVANVLLVLAGNAMGLGLWAILYGRDLWKTLIFALVQGDQFRTTIHNTMAYFLSFVYQWPGGRILEAGVFLAVAVVVVRLSFHVRTHGRRALFLRGLPMPLVVEIYLLLNLLLYLVWFAVFVGNKAPQYGGDLYFFAIPLAARGYVGVGELAAVGLRRPAVAAVGAIAVAGIVFSTSTVVRHLFPLNPVALRSSDRVYHAIRADLGTFVSKNDRVMMGVAAYPYLYDRSYATPMRLVGSYFLKPEAHSSFLNILRRALRQRKLYDPAAEPPAWLARHLAESAPLVVSNDDGEGYQYILYDPRVWGPSFREVGVVIVQHPDLGYIQPDGLVGTSEVQFFAIFVRRDRIAQYERDHGLSADSLRVGKYTSLLTFARSGEAAKPISATAWAKLKPEVKRAQIVAYLATHRWFGLDGSIQRSETLDALVPSIDSILTSSSAGLGFERTLGEAVVKAMIQSNVVERWAR